MLSFFKFYFLINIYFDDYIRDINAIQCYISKYEELNVILLH